MESRLLAAVKCHKHSTPRLRRYSAAELEEELRINFLIKAMAFSLWCKFENFCAAERNRVLAH